MNKPEVLSALEPHTSEIVAIVRREDGIVSPWHEPSSLDKNLVRMDYLARVDGDDYVVSVGDAEMQPGNVSRVLDNATRYDMYATGTEQSRLWVARNGRRLSDITRRFRPLYQGYVHIVPRDAFDVQDVHGELSRGMVGYTLRRGPNAILHTTGDFTDDPDFFLRAVRAVHPGNRIDEKSHFTAHEEQRFAEIHRPIIDRLEQLIQRDGTSAAEALDRYADQYEETDDISEKIATILDINARLEPVTRMHSMFATYHLGEGNHILIEKRGNDKRSSIKVTHEYVADGETVTRTYEQPWVYPNMLVVDAPSKSVVNRDDHDKRLFALKDNDALELNALIASLQ